MLNAEKYKDKIYEVSNGNDFFMVDKNNREIKTCNSEIYGTNCATCLFRDSAISCRIVKAKWLVSEFEEPIKLTKREYEFCKFLKGKDYYISKDTKDGEIELYFRKPVYLATSGYFIADDSGACICRLRQFDLSFDFLSTIKVIAIDDLLSKEITIIDNKKDKEV